MRIYLAPVFVTILWITSSSITTTYAASDIEQRKLQMQQSINKQKKIFAAYKRNSKNEFEAYRAQQQETLKKAIKENWRQFQIYKADFSLLGNKPQNQPAYGNQVKHQLAAKSPNLKTSIVKPRDGHLSQQKTANTQPLNLYGMTLSMPVVTQPVMSAGADKQAITDYLQANPDYEKKLVVFARDTAERLHLDDWGTYLLMREIARQLYPDSWQTRRLAQWKWMNQLGYDLRIAETSNELRLLLPVTQTIYGHSYIFIKGNKYYLDTPAGSDLHTYPQQFDKLAAIENINPTQVRWSDDKQNIHVRQLDYSNDGEHYQITLKFDIRTLRMMQDYPQMIFSRYFKTPLSPKLEQSLKDQLMPVLAGKSKYQQASLLLKLVQKSLAYQTDQQQFGKENYLFAEESIGFPYADCEDRAILYAWLVHELLDLPYLVLLYPNHLTTAIALNGTGDTIHYGNTIYLIADPTYIGAPIGKAMHPQIEPKIIYASQ